MTSDARCSPSLTSTRALLGRVWLRAATFVTLPNISEFGASAPVNALRAARQCGYVRARIANPVAASLMKLAASVFVGVVFDALCVR